MSRTDQYIGLTSEGKKFASTLHWENVYETDGAWNQMSWDVWSDDMYVYIEVVQCEPWSSGPMYFTRLLKIPHREHPMWNSTKSFGDTIKYLFSWENAYEKMSHIRYEERPEYDEEKGEIYL